MKCTSLPLRAARVHHADSAARRRGRSRRGRSKWRMPRVAAHPGSSHAKMQTRPIDGISHEDCVQLGYVEGRDISIIEYRYADWDTSARPTDTRRN